MNIDIRAVAELTWDRENLIISKPEGRERRRRTVIYNNNGDHSNMAKNNNNHHHPFNGSFLCKHGSATTLSFLSPSVPQQNLWG